MQNHRAYTHGLRFHADTPSHTRVFSFRRWGAEDFEMRFAPKSRSRSRLKRVTADTHNFVIERDLTFFFLFFLPADDVAYIFLVSHSWNASSVSSGPKT